ncbi:class I SAM-dependent methyltransferase [Flavobacterium beibuense]|uniref:Methyltransferase family protein n=1 Tax=Flavobacterium beibuense TaxID=657326 RepID=A0A444W7J9_9FLAO|nr:class I SAM-dependent methyltransferase [Flavobacterium beibuense]RYJ41865.1 Methyltransferase family protein [Flavobacterium beibuense]
MYRLAKKLISKLISKQTLFRYELTLRRAYATIYSGDKHECGICHKKLSRFIVLENNNILCPNCGSLARDRRLVSLLNSGFLDKGITVLDFSPSRSVYRELNKNSSINYLSTDLSGNFFAKYSFDITNLDLEDESVDLIICYHILEHIENDSKAMSELYRVLKPKGKCIIQTPFKDRDIYEDFSITSPEEREIHFGQDDHVRVYSVNGLKERLEKTGFSVSVNEYKEDNYLGLKKENILITAKN